MNPKRVRHIRSFFSSATALLLVALYLFSLAGIDIHCDHETGRIYVVSGFSVSDCEHIHATSPCHHGDDDGECESDEDCCSDVFLSILPQGDEVSFRPMMANQPLIGTLVFRTTSPVMTGMALPSPGMVLSPDPFSLQSRLCVLRV